MLVQASIFKTKNNCHPDASDFGILKKKVLAGALLQNL
jgi:hypothetical protein